MGVDWRGVYRNASIRTKMLVIILPLIVVPMLILAGTGLFTAGEEADKASARYLKQRENDVRTIAENPVIRDYFNNRFYGLDEEAEFYRQEIERSLRRFAERSNSNELIYPQVRYVDDEGQEIAKVVDGEISTRHTSVADAPFFAAARKLSPGETYVSSIGPEMRYAMPVYEFGAGAQQATFQGVVVLDFLYPLADFRRTRGVIARTFIIITAVSLAIAVLITVDRVRRLTDPIRRLAEAAKGIASGEREVAVDVASRDEIGGLAQSFNEMALSLKENEAALERKAVEATALYEIGQEITAQVALEPILELIADHVRTLLRADVGVLALRVEGSDRFEVCARSGVGTEALEGLTFTPGAGLGGAVVAGGEPRIVADYFEEYGDSPFLGIVRETGLHAVVAVPLKSRGEVSGVLYALSRTPNQFGEVELQLLGGLATQATISIDNAKLYQQVRRHAEELEHKVAERTKELQQTNLKLEEASRHKSEFLANMSHELRTPMNAIIGFTRLVMRRSKEMLPERQYENLEKILVSADHLLELINDILDLSKIEAGRIDLYPETFALDHLVDLCLRTIEPTVKSTEIELVKDIEESLPALHADQDKLRQILINLISNAVKFTEKGSVTVRARARDGMVAIAVADTGIGIPEDSLGFIFEEFRQVDSSSTRQYGGTGLGLSISRHLARLMGGDIGVESRLGAGSTFTVTIPLGLQEAAAASGGEAVT